jgi:hypothetical protein
LQRGGIALNHSFPPGAEFAIQCFRPSCGGSFFFALCTQLTARLKTHFPK